MKMKSVILNYFKAGLMTGLLTAFIVSFIQILNTVIFFSHFKAHIKALRSFFLYFPFFLYAGIFLVWGFIFSLAYGFIMQRKRGNLTRRDVDLFVMLFVLPVYLLLAFYWIHFMDPFHPAGPFFVNFPISCVIIFLVLGLWLYLIRSAVHCLLFKEAGRFIRLFRTCIIFLVFTSVILVPTLPANTEKAVDDGGIRGNTAPPPGEKNNVLLITIDTLRRDYLSCYGNRKLETRHIDALAAGGVKFNNAVVHAPLTLTSHTSLLTSLYPTSHGVRSNSRYKASPSLSTLPEILFSQGYQTAAFVSALVLDSTFGLDQGFLVYDDEFSTEEEKMLLFYKNRIIVLRLLEKLGWMKFPILEEVERNAGDVTEEVIQWLDGNRKMMTQEMGKLTKKGPAGWNGSMKWIQ